MILTHLVYDLPFKVGDILVVGLTRDLHDLGQQLVTVVSPLSLVHVDHQLLHNLHQVLLRNLHTTNEVLINSTEYIYVYYLNHIIFLQRNANNNTILVICNLISTYHSINEVKSPQSDGLIFVIQALQNQIFMGLNTLWVGCQNFRHGQKS